MRPWARGTAASKLAADCFCVNFIVLLVAASVRVEGVAQNLFPYVSVRIKEPLLPWPSNPSSVYRIYSCRVGQIADLS